MGVLFGVQKANKGKTYRNIIDIPQHGYDSSQVLAYVSVRKWRHTWSVQGWFSALPWVRTHGWWFKHPSGALYLSHFMFSILTASPLRQILWIKTKSDTLWKLNQLVGMGCTHKLCVDPQSWSPLHVDTDGTRWTSSFLVAEPHPKGLWLWESWMGTLGDEGTFSVLNYTIKCLLWWKLGGLTCFVHFNVILGGGEYPGQALCLTLILISADEAVLQ